MGNAVNWYKFNSIEDFDNWHNAIIKELNLPKPSVNNNGAVVADAIITNSYTHPFIISDTDIRVYISPDYADGLSPSENPYPDERQTL